MEINIKYPHKDPVPVLTLDPEHFCRQYMDQLRPGQVGYILNSYKEVNILYQDYRLDFAIKKGGIWFDFTIKAPKGMVLNGSSVPAIGKALVNEDYHNRAWVAHDVVYLFKGKRVNQTINGDSDSQPDLVSPKITRKEIDQVFKEVVKLSGAPKFEQWLAYAAIRVGGGFLWRQPYSTDSIIIVNPK